MNILEYYLELLEKPEYMLSTSEQFFIDIFPFIILAVIGVIFIIVGIIVDFVKNHK